MDEKFPFTPKSNSKLKPGQFWPIRLLNGNYGCGVVLDIPNDETLNDKRVFIWAYLIGQVTLINN